MKFLLKYFLAFLLAVVTAFAPGCTLPWESRKQEVFPNGRFSLCAC